MGVEQPLPGNGTFHSGCSHFAGYVPDSALPLSCGPRQRGQSDEAEAAETVKAVKSSVTKAS
jgi:hypothetical protein